MSIVERARPEIRALVPYASARSLAAPAQVNLDANENPWASPADGGMALNRYPDPQPASLLSALSDLYGLPSNQVLITRGSDEAIDLLVRAFCRSGQDAVAQCPPCFGMYAIAARIQGARVIDCPLQGGDFDLPVESLCQIQDPDLKLIFLCSPNNPTGSSLDSSEVLELCAAQPDALVVVDEAYAEFAGHSLLSEVGRVPNLAVLRTLSKAWSLAGARCGALLASQDVIDLLRRILPPYPLPTPSICAVERALSPEGRQIMTRQVKRLIGLRNEVSRRLAEDSSVSRVWDSEANFLLVRMPEAARFYRHAAEAGVLLRDFSAVPGLENCLRISIGTEEDMERLFGVLEQWRRAA